MSNDIQIQPCIFHMLVCIDRTAKYEIRGQGNAVAGTDNLIDMFMYTDLCM